MLIEKATAIYAAAAVKGKIPEKWVRDLDFYGTRITEDEKIQIVMHYKMPLPFSVFGINSVSVENTYAAEDCGQGADGNRNRKNTLNGGKRRDHGVYRKILYQISQTEKLSLSVS